MITFTIDKPDDRFAWLEARAPHFNASSAAVLYDRHPFQSAADYAVEKLGAVSDEPATDPMNRGRHLEAGIADWFGETMGWTLIESPVLHGYGPLLATVDRFVAQTGSPVEIKTVSYYTSEPLPYWIDQCQAILACTDTDTLYLVWMDASMTLQWCEVDRDEAHIADMVGRAERFMAAIELGMMPDWVTPESQHIAALHPDPVGEVVLDDDTVALLRDFADHRDAVKYHEAEMKAIKDRVANVLGDREAGVYDGQTVVSWSKVKGRSSFDQATFKADHPEMVGKYTRVGSPSRRFMVNIHTGGEEE